jgi:hypothetical protein
MVCYPAQIHKINFSPPGRTNFCIQLKEIEPRLRGGYAAWVGQAPNGALRMMGLRKTILLFTLICSSAMVVSSATQQDPGGRFGAHPAQDANAAKNLVELDLPGTQHWVDTGLDIHSGDRLVINVTGTLHYAAAKENGPEGLPRGWKDLMRNMPVNNAGRGAAVARIGDTESALVFLVGATKEVRAAVSGRLFVGINQPGNDQVEGSYHVKIEIVQRAASSTTRSRANTPAPTATTTATTAPAAPQGATPLQPGATTGGAPPASTAPAPEVAPTSAAAASLPADVFDKIPRRIADRDGNAGDMVNFVILGTEDQVKQAFQAAGWVQVDRSIKEAALHGLLSSLSKEAYTNMPMSELFLFGRGQDYGFAHAEPITVAASRHHLRLWKAPFTVNGQPLLVGAATHDIGFERDQRNGGITHKIDPDIDVERSYVEQTLRQTGLFSTVTYVTPANTLTDAKTATGGSFHSDGKVLVLILSSTSASPQDKP